MRLLVDKYNLRNEKGSVLMEAIICLPVLLLVSLGVMQFAHIWYCRTIVHYAAYCAARATLTAPAGDENEEIAARSAAEIVCAPIAFMNPTKSRDFSLPGINPPAPGENNSIQGSGAVRYIHNNQNNCDGNILNVSVSSSGDWHRQVDVEMKVPLLIPFAGHVIGELVTLWTGGNFDITPTTPDGPDPVTGKRVIHKFSNEWTSRICLHERAYIVKPFKSTWSSF